MCSAGGGSCLPLDSCSGYYMSRSSTRENAEAEELLLIAAARRSVLEQSQRAQFEAASYEQATQLLESLPPANVVDNRVELALDITFATRDDYRPDLSRRALYAAFPAGSTVKNQRLLRRWLTFTAIIEGCFGNVERALKYKLASLKLCEELNDRLGFCSEWANFATFATGAGLYSDAVQYATVALVALEAKADDAAGWVCLRSTAFLSRANVLIRLGRLEEAKSDLALCLSTITYPPSAAVRHHIVFAQYLFAEIQLDLGDRSAARAALHAAATWADVCGVSKYKLQIERVLARLSALECGFETAVARLTELLEQAYELEANSGETSFEDVVLDVLYTLERLYREDGDVVGANKWLTAIGAKLRTNATRMLDALASKPVLDGELASVAKLAEIDAYLEVRSIARPALAGTAPSSLDDLIRLAASASAIEDSTKEHGVRVARLASLVASEFGLSSSMQRGLEAGCLVHDIGKLSVSPSILAKRATLDAGERNLYDAHPHVGAELLEAIKHPEQGVIRNVVHFHHHAYGGSAATESPVGDAIPLEARIASVCDEYDALVAGRPRRSPIPSSAALREIFAQRGARFDPTVVDAFVDLVRRLRRKHSDLQAYLSQDADSMGYFAMHRTLRRAAERALTADQR